MLLVKTLHSFIASLMHAERKAADGLNSASAAVESPLRARARTAIVRALFILVSPKVLVAFFAVCLRRSLLPQPRREQCDGDHRIADSRWQGAPYRHLAG